MRYTRMKALAAAVLLSTALGACGDAGDEDGGGSPDVDAAETDFPEGSTMAEISDAGEVTIGVKYDQPGIGFKGATDDEPSGFDIEMAKIVAGALGIEEDAITWKETISDNREPFLIDGKVDLVFASYSMTPERQAVVGQAGPYFITGQQLLVTSDNDAIQGPEDVAGEEVCSVTGSTSIETIEQEYDATARGFATYSECVEQVLNGSFDAMTTDGTILLGYAAENPDELKVVGPEFSEENIGIGYQDPDDTEMCQFLVDTLEKSFEDGTWKQAFDSTLGEAGVDAPKPPKLQPCK